MAKVTQLKDKLFMVNASMQRYWRALACYFSVPWEAFACFHLVCFVNELQFNCFIVRFDFCLAVLFGVCFVLLLFACFVVWFVVCLVFFLIKAGGQVEDRYRSRIVPLSKCSC